MFLGFFRPSVKKVRFLRVFAGFCSFIVNILAMASDNTNKVFWQGLIGNS